jgi:hypothetical protein
MSGATTGQPYVPVLLKLRMMMQRRLETPDRSEQIVRAAFARLDVLAIAVALGALGALTLWLMTAALLIKGAPPGMHVGGHLGLLEHFLPRYGVSWRGSFLGAVYGFIVGFVVGGIVGTAWNLTHHIYLMIALRRDRTTLDI